MTLAAYLGGDLNAYTSAVEELVPKAQRVAKVASRGTPNYPDILSELYWVLCACVRDWFDKSQCDNWTDFDTYVYIRLHYGAKRWYAQRHRLIAQSDKTAELTRTTLNDNIVANCKRNLDVDLADFLETHLTPDEVDLIRRWLVGYTQVELGGQLGCTQPHIARRLQAVFRKLATYW